MKNVLKTFSDVLIDGTNGLKKQMIAEGRKTNVTKMLHFTIFRIISHF